MVTIILWLTAKLAKTTMDGTTALGLVKAEEIGFETSYQGRYELASLTCQIWLSFVAHVLKEESALYLVTGQDKKITLIRSQC